MKINLFPFLTVIAQVLSKNHQKKLGQKVVLTACTPIDSLSNDKEEVQSDDQGETESEPESNYQDTQKETGSKRASKNKTKDTQEKEGAISTPLLHPPVVLPLDPMIAKVLKHSADIMKTMSQEVLANLFIDETTNSITLTQNESSPQDWPSTATEKLAFCLSEMICREEIPVPEEAASNVYPMIMKFCNQEGLQLAFGQGDNKVCVAGKTQLVNTLKNDVEEVCSRMIKKVEVIKFNEEDYAFLKEMCFTKIQNQNRSLQFKMYDLDKSLSVDGCLRDVGVIRGKIHSYLAHIKTPVNVHPLVIEFLREGKGSEILQKIMHNTRCVSYFELDCETKTLKLFILCAQEDAKEAEQLSTKLAIEIKVESIDLSQYFLLNVADGQKFASYKETMSKTHPHLPSIENSKLLVIGSTDIVSILLEAYKEFITEECSKTENCLSRKEFGGY